MKFDTIFEIGDAMVQLISGDWQPTADGDELEMTFIAGVEDPKTMTGRKVWVVPNGQEQVDGGTRGLDRNQYTLSLVVAERFTSEENRGKPTVAWVKELLQFTNRQAKKLSLARKTNEDPLFPAPLNDVKATKWTEQMQVDWDELRKNSIFVAQTDLTYERDEAEDGA